MITFEQITTMDIDAREVGTEIAAANNEDQCEFFEGLAEGFELFDEGDGDFNVGVQMCWINALEALIGCEDEKATEILEQALKG